MRPLSAVAALFFSLLSMSSWAQNDKVIVFADLPPTVEVVKALSMHPRVQGAQSMVGYEMNRQRMLDAGPHEFALSAGAFDRRVTEPAPTQRFTEWELILERPIRLPSKARIDHDIGVQGLLGARHAVQDARHESGRELLQLWFAWLRENAQIELFARQAELAHQEQSVVERRKQAGDAPQLDLNLAAAAVMQAESLLLQVRSRETNARSRLAILFPDITIPPKLSVLPPRPMKDNLAQWRARVLEHNHELAVARSEIDRRALLAHRANAERTPDPTVGLSYSSERNGEEGVFGLFVSVPLPGAARKAMSDGARFQINAARQLESSVARKLEMEVATAYESALSTFQNWGNLRRAAEGMRGHASLTARAYQLGEKGLADVLVARRLALESEVAALTAQLEAQEARYRLMLDAHLLWPVDTDE